LNRYIDANMETNTIENTRPFTMKRVVKVGSMISGTPSVVKCIWTPIKTANLVMLEGTLEDAQSRKSCSAHDYCKGHLCVSPVSGGYLIPYGFAVGGEIVSSDGSLMNQGLITGDKSRNDIVSHCFKKIATKRGILRKSCNGCRSTNTIRLVASPSTGPPHSVEIPDRVLERAVFMYVCEDGRCTTRRLQVGDVIALGRCPSQGADSALPMKVTRGSPGIDSVRVPLETCRLNNTDFDGDELWMFVPMSLAGMSEANACWDRIWNKKPIDYVLKNAYETAGENGIPNWIDPAMLTTMTLEEMSTHPGGKMYESMILKPKSWKTMYKTMISKTYWKSHVIRSETGIVNTIMSRHGLAGPYGFMRMGMMLGSCVTSNAGMLSVRSTKQIELPIVPAHPDMNVVACSSAMAKMSRIMYQNGIDMSKHGLAESKIAAINTIMAETGSSYGIVNVGGTPTVALIKNSIVHSTTDMCTNMGAILKANDSNDMIMRACAIVSMIEEIDGVRLTGTERIAAAFFITFLARSTGPIMGRNSIDVMNDLGLDWYTSSTCSDVRWFKNVIRTGVTNPDVSMSTDISSVLGAIFIGNLSMIVSKPEVSHRSDTVIGSTFSGYSSRST